MKMPSINILQLAKVMFAEIGNGDTKIHTIGIRPGEKLHEVLVSHYEAARAYDSGNYYVILPYIDMNGLHSIYLNRTPLNAEYNSLENTYLTDEELRQLLINDGWLNNERISDLENYSKQELLEYFKRERWIK